MITLDSPKLQADLRRYTSMIAGRFELLGGRKLIILKRQAGLLARTLINISPPKNKQKTSERITQRVTNKFAVMSEYSGYGDSVGGSKKAGHGDVRWYAFSKFAIYGVAKDSDMTGASADELYRLYFGTTKTGRIKGQRGRQKVYVWQRITTKAKTVKELIKRLLRHIGRLKAGWAVSWKDAGAPGRPLPQWIEQHVSGARGYSINLLSAPSEPSFTIVNTAKGVTSEQVEIAARAALQIRLKALEADMLFAIRKPHEWNEREARAEAAIEEAA